MALGIQGQRSHQLMQGAGRFAPSPSGDLHIGNLRTALLAWLFARSTSRRFHLRVEDLDRVQPGSAKRQLADLTRLGIDFDGEVWYQSERTDAYRFAIETLKAADLVYECFCSRKDILSAPSAPHAPPGSYPQKCRNLDSAQREKLRLTKTPALRLRAEVTQWSINDELHGEITSAVDDLVLVRADGVFAYNLAVVVDDAAQGIDQVVRGDDLLTSAARQSYLAHILGLPELTYAHVPLVVNAQGERLAKRDGAITLSRLADKGIDLWELITQSLDLPNLSPRELLNHFEPDKLPRDPWVFTPTN